MRRYVCTNDSCTACQGTGITASGAVCTWSVTPYERHSELDHTMLRSSPNGVDIIEECDNCGARFMHNPCIGYPVTLY